MTIQVELLTNEERVRVQKLLLDHGLLSSCITCEDFRKDKALCVRHKACPPLETIVVGCLDWIREIPF